MREDPRSARRARRRPAWAVALALVTAGCAGGAAPATTTTVGPTTTLGSTTTTAATTTAPTTTVAGSTTTTTPGTTSDQVVFYHGALITIDDQMPTASALLVQGGRIAAVGSDDEVLARAERGAQLIDLGGRALMPGFVDAHAHMFGSVTTAEDPDRVEVQDTLLAGGITTTAELFVDDGLLADLQAMADRDALRLRLSLYLNYNDACGNPLGDWYRAYAPTREPGEMLRIGGIKIYSDGGFCNVPAATFDYPGYGSDDPYFTAPELEAVIRELDAAGYQLAIHALGDRAIDMVLAAYTAVLHGDNPRHHRIDHNAILHPEQYGLYTQAGAVAVIFGAYHTCVALGTSTALRYVVPAEYRTWEWPWRDLMEANPGVHFAWHGDMPGIFPPSAFPHLYGLVTRDQLAEDGTVCEAPDWLEANALDVDTALELMTMGAAYALDRDAEVGSLTPGKFADLIILSDDPRTVEPRALADLQVLMTMVGGQVEHCREGAEALCPAPVVSPGPAEPRWRDDFEGEALAPEWAWTREDPSAWSLGGGALHLSTGSFSLVGEERNAPLLLRAAPEGDFALVARLDFAPGANFQFAGLVVYGDDNNYVALGRSYCGVVPPCVGDGAYLANGEASPTAEGATIPVGGLPAGPVELRLVRRGNAYTGWWSTDGADWVQVGSTTAAFIPGSVGLLATSSGTGAPALQAVFDWVEAGSP